MTLKKALKAIEMTKKSIFGGPKQNKKWINKKKSYF